MNLRPSSLRSLAAAIAMAASSSLSAAEYTIDPVHTRIVFTVDHAGFSQAIGTFSAPRGRVEFDSDDWTQAKVEVEIPLDTLQLGDAEWNTRMLKRSFLDAERQPVARFVSTTVEPLDDRRALVHGELSLRGRSRPVTLEVTLNRLAPHPLTMRGTAGFSATTTLDREDFGITAWPRLIGREVELRIEVEAQRRRDD